MVWDCSKVLDTAPMCFAAVAQRCRAFMRLDRRGDAAADINKCLSITQFQQEARGVLTQRRADVSFLSSVPLSTVRY